MCCAEAGDEMIFECLNGSLGGIDAVLIRFEKLYLRIVVVLNEVF